VLFETGREDSGDQFNGVGFEMKMELIEESKGGQSESNLVAETRKLLASGALQLPLRVEGWHKSLSDGGHYIRHATGRILATVEFVPVENETGRPALDGNAPARALVTILNAVPVLCDETEYLRSQNTKLLEALQTSADFFHDTHRNVFGADFETCSHGQCEASRAAVNPKG
jgi:hypothetical protein